jgi:hypothetical protein
MKTLIYESWVIGYDDVLTREIFKDVISGPQRCGCGNCENFILARDQVYPESLKKILNQLGIDYQKETEISHFNRVRTGCHFYGGWFHFVGQIQKAPEDEGANIYGRVPEELDFAWSFSNKQYLIPEAFGRNPVIQLDWIGKVPWVIDTEEPT